MKLLKAFVSGIIVPALVFPMIRYALYVKGHVGETARPIQFFFLAIPLAWGIWNVIFFALEKSCPMVGKPIRPWAFGISLGLIFSIIGVFIIGVPEKLLGLEGPGKYSLLIICPLLFGILWRYAVNFFNVLLGVE